MNMRELFGKWAQIEPRTKLLALGTAVLVAASIWLSLGNCAAAGVASDENANEEKLCISEEGVLIEDDAEPVPYATDATLLLEGMMGALANEDFVWLGTDDPLCAIRFTEGGADAYYGDILTSCTLEVYEIEVVDNGRAGIWRVLYPDGSSHDARFSFTWVPEKGVYRITSSALPNSDTYEADAFTSENVLDW